MDREPRALDYRPPVREANVITIVLVAPTISHAVSVDGVINSMHPSYRTSSLQTRVVVTVLRSKEPSHLITLTSDT